ncbi:MAG: PhnD/SsuA/transferrin family substrate-binding protein, partial [Fimbriimonadaceae bacterium]
MSDRPIIVGAVVYDPKVTVIWDIIRRFFEDRGCPMDTVYYTNYELQVRSLIEGSIDVAWNSPLAWLDSQRLGHGRCRAIAMRDTDRDRVSNLLVRADSGIRSPADLKGRTVAFGAKDSPQATLIPQGMLLEHGLRPGEDYRVRRFDVLVGKHGDHVGGERAALECLKSGEADAAWALDLNWQLWSGDGTADPGKIV